MNKSFFVIVSFITLFVTLFAMSSRPRYVTPSQDYHIVKKNETLQDISKEHDISPQKLMVYNNLASQRVFPGQKVYLFPRPKVKREYITPRSIPPSKFHMVEEGESISRISKMYNVGIIDLIEFNNLSSLKLKTDQKIYLAKDVRPYSSAPTTIPQPQKKEPSTASSTPKAPNKYTTKPSKIKSDLSAKSKKEKEEFASVSRSEVEKVKVRQKRSPTGLIIPIQGKITSEFGMRNGRPHKGIDISAAVGEPICAVSDGKVVYAGSQRGYGNVVILEHDDYVMTVYAHNEANLVRPGETVKQGQPIATLGNTGTTSGPHLHFEYRVQGKALNPRQVLPGL